MNKLTRKQTVSGSAVGTNSFPGSDSVGVKVRVKFTEIVLVQVGIKI